MEENFSLNESQIKFNHINHEITDIYHDISVKLKMSESMFEILYSIYELGEGCRPSDICKVCFLPKQTAHSAIRKMEREEYLQICSGKGREKKIFLTDKGRDLVAKKVIPVMKVENETFQQFQEEEQAQLLDLLERYTAVLKANMEELGEQQLAKEVEKI